MNIRFISALAVALGMLGPASAAVVQTTMVGHIATISPPLRGLGVEIGDEFGLVLRFDDSLGGLSCIGGYCVQTDIFSTGMDGWYGSLATFLASRYPSETSSVTKQSWFRPPTTLHHEEWSMFGMFIITNYVLNPGGEHYGWYGYGDPAQLAFLIDSVVTTPVPEPQTYALVLLGLTVIGVGRLRQQQDGVLVPSRHK